MPLGKRTAGILWEIGSGVLSGGKVGYRACVNALRFSKKISASPNQTDRTVSRKRKKKKRVKV
jgi:hypothetical protein